MLNLFTSGYLKIGAACPLTVVANPKKNAENALKTIIEAAKHNVQVLALPELFLSSSSCQDLFGQETLIKECEKALLLLISETKEFDIVFAIGLPVKIGFKLYNCAAICHKGEILGFVPKQYLSNSNASYEKRWFESGMIFQNQNTHFGGKQIPMGKLIFKLNECTMLGVEIGDDLSAPVSPSTIMALSGANVILNLSASYEIVTKHEHRHELVKNQSAKNICAYAYSSSGIGESSTDLVFSGDCMIYETGKRLNQTKRFWGKNQSAYAVIDTQKINAQRQNDTIFKDNGDVYSNSSYEIIETHLSKLDEEKIDIKYDPHPFIPSDTDEMKKRCKEIFSIQTSALAKRMNHTNIKKAVVGVSGGLDSTLALLVIIKTMDLLSLPRENVICITMPGFGTTSGTKNNSIELMKSLGVNLKIIDITPACKQHFKDIGHDESVLDVTYENVQARERTQILMDIANKENALLVGTGDLSELALGWCTYNGDHMSMYSINCSVPKTLMPHLISFVKDTSDERISGVLQKILETPISPELLPPDKDGNIGQKTEDKIGPYELHDFFLYHFIKFGFGQDKLLFMAKKAFHEKYDEETIRFYLGVFMKRFFISQFKRSCVPDGPMVGSVALSPRGNWRMPSDADFDMWMK